MSEEVKELNDGTFSGLKKTIIGTLGINNPISRW